MAGGTKALEKVKGMYIRFAPLFQMFALAYHFRISIYDAQYLCPIHVVTFTLISNLATDYIQKRRGDPGLFSFEYNLSPNLISK